MNCPVCNVTLTMTDRQGVEIDYCQKCRGVWLDRGELDKIIERSVGSQSHVSSEPRHEKSHEPHYKQQHDDNYYGHKKKKKESFLSDLFDF